MNLQKSFGICSTCYDYLVFIETRIPCFDKNDKFIENQSIFMCHKCILILKKSNELYCKIDKISNSKFNWHYYYPFSYNRRTRKACKMVISYRASISIKILNKKENSLFSDFPEDIINIIADLMWKM